MIYDTEFSVVLNNKNYLQHIVTDKECIDYHNGNKEVDKFIYSRLLVQSVNIFS